MRRCSEILPLYALVLFACGDERERGGFTGSADDGSTAASSGGSSADSSSSFAGPSSESSDSGGSASDSSSSSDATGCADAECSGGLGTSGNRFTIGGEARFLLGVSYFSCLYAHDDVLAADLEFLAARGVQLVRCWVNWPIGWDAWDTESAANLVLVDADGNLDADGLARLQAVIARAEANGMFVDMTFNQDTPNKPFAAHRDGVVAAAEALVGVRSVLFNLQNETDHSNNVPEFFMNETQTLQVRNAVRAVDPERLLGASTRNPTALASYTLGAELDVGALHCCRNAGATTDWAAATLDAVADARAALGDGIPIYMQEPNRCGSGGQYATCDGDGSEFVDAAVNAKQAGAAGWVFHTTAGYDLRTQSLESQLEPTELDALMRLADALAATPWGD